MNSITVNWEDVVWHGHTPTLKGTGSVTFERKSENDKTIYYWGSASNDKVYSDADYRFNVTAYIAVDGRVIQTITVTNKSYQGTGTFADAKNPNSFEYDGSGTVTVHYVCGQTGGCTQGFPDVIVGSGNLGNLPYKSYTAPTKYEITSLSNYGIINTTPFTGTYEISGGYNNNISNTHVGIYNYNNFNSLVTTKSVSNNRISFILYNNNQDRCQEGSSYSTRLEFTDSGSGISTEFKAGGGIKTIYTATAPNIKSFKSSLETFSPQDNVTLTWETQGSKLSGYTEGFETSLYINNKSVKTTNSNTGEFTITKDVIDECFSIDNQSANNSSCEIKLVSRNKTAEDTCNTTYRVEQQLNSKIQYTPTKQVDLTGIDNAGKVVAIEEHPITNIKWTYPVNSGGAGVCTGFRINVYADSGYNNLISSNTMSVSYNEFVSNGEYTYPLDNAIDLMRGVMNYAEIIPYYEYPNGGATEEGPELRIGQVVKPYRLMSTPSIAYPINETTWHNKEFRILFNLCSDNDYDTYSNFSSMFGGGTIQGNYKYSDMEIKINGIVYAFSGKYTSNSATKYIFSSDIDKSGVNNHRKSMSINPSLISGFADTDTYTISIRVQRGNYYFTDSEMRDSSIKTWSSWSNTITLHKQEAVQQNLVKGQEINYTHYKGLSDLSRRLWNCYPIISTNIQERKRGDYIQGSKEDIIGEYESCYNALKTIVQGIHSYCDYDRSAVDMNSIEEFNVEHEIITVDENNSIGKNYIKLLTRIAIEYLK